MNIARTASSMLTRDANNFPASSRFKVGRLPSCIQKGHERISSRSNKLEAALNPTSKDRQTPVTGSAALAADYVMDTHYPDAISASGPLAASFIATANGFSPRFRADAPFTLIDFGCGQGGELLTIAAANPAGQFIGVDMNPAHVVTGARRAAAAGLSNVSFLCEDFENRLVDSLPDFDIGIVNGVWSWVTDSKRVALRNILRRRLKPNGLAIVSYIAMPGWAPTLPIQAIFKKLTRASSASSLERVDAALRAASRLRELGAEYFVANPAAQKLFDELLASDRQYLAHEFLNRTFNPFYVTEVAAFFEHAGLRYAGCLPERENDLIFSLCDDRFLPLFDAETDPMQREFIKDLINNTGGRCDIYIKSDAPATPPMRANLEPFWFLPGPQADVEALSLTKHGRRLSIEDPFYRQLSSILRQPCIAIADLAARDSIARLAQGELEQKLIRAVFLGVAVVGLENTNAPIDANKRQVSLPMDFNRIALTENILPDGHRLLADPVIGGGLELTAMEAELLIAHMSDKGEGIEALVDDRLREIGHALKAFGKPIEDRGWRLALIAAVNKEFVSKKIPLLLRHRVLSKA